jgi:hypothetical protein
MPDFTSPVTLIEQDLSHSAEHTPITLELQTGSPATTKAKGQYSWLGFVQFRVLCITSLPGSSPMPPVPVQTHFWRYS